MTLARISVDQRKYLMAIAVGGPLLAAGTALGGAATVVADMGRGDWARASLLLLLAAATYGRSFPVTNKYNFDVSDVAYVAMLLLFPLSLPGLLVFLALGFHVARRPSRSVDDFFNLGQTTAYVTAGALCLAAADRWGGFGPSRAGLPAPAAIIAAAATMMAVNNAQVALAISLETGARFWRLWRGEVMSVARTYAALTALGVVAALVMKAYPLALPGLLLPVLLVHYALRRDVQLRADTRAALASLVDVVELRDPYTAGHSLRVAETARALALRLGMTGEEADLIETAGRVHDLGKVAISPAVLLKYGPLEEGEWAQIRQHPALGAEVVGRFAGYRGCAELVQSHHERWDGAGYPDGLCGDRIPFGARILAVADAFDAMTSMRPYRSAKGPDAVLRVLEDGAGVQWDPVVVQAMVAYQRERAVEPMGAPVGYPVLA